jgi:SAM-dependent methyltransferase
MSLKDLQHSWDQLGAKDAMWAVLTGPLAASRAWDRDAFFQTGVDEIAHALRRVQAVGADVRRGRALDFGCGVGRLSQALAGEFEQVDGVDLAPSMIRQARELNGFPDRCRYHRNDRADLAIFPSSTFDFIYTTITLQHMAPQYSRRYIEEFFRVARPGAVVMFQIPAERVPVPDPPRTRRAEPLPRQAARAAIEAPAALRCAPGASFPLYARLRNASPHLWPWAGEEDGRLSIRFGNHWRGRFGWPTLKYDDARMALPHDLAPGQEIEAMLLLTAPQKPGRYILELDVVQEHVRWFAKAGSRPARIKVHVDPSMREGAVEGLLSRMEMHGIPRPDVEALIAASGATLLAVDDDDAPGPGWTSYRYIARRC